MSRTEITYTHNLKLPDMSFEQSIDTDFSLPDYYPEVSKILKCLTEFNVVNKNAVDGLLEIGGLAVITLIYADSTGGINSYLHTCPFTKTVEIDGLDNNSFVKITPRANLINSKATAPRKLEVHGSCALLVSVTKIKPTQVLSNIDEAGIYTRCVYLDYNEPCEPIEKNIFIDDEIKISQNNPSIAKIIRHCATAEITECKSVSDKIVVKGDIYLEILYCGEASNKPILIKETRGFSQIIDCNEISDDISFESCIKILSFELHPKTSIDGEVRVVTFESKLALEIFPHILCKEKIVTDAFSGNYDTKISKVTLPCEKLKDTVNENYVCQKYIDILSGEMNEICDLWSKCNVDYVSSDGGDVLVKGTVIIYILGIDSDCTPVFYERPIDFEYRYTVGETEKIRCNPNVKIVAVNYTLDSNGGIDVAVELNIKMNIFTSSNVVFIGDIKVDQDNILKKDSDTAITLYFAEGETVWEIAEKYCTSPEKIMSANCLDGYDTVCNQMLLIPNVI